MPRCASGTSGWRPVKALHRHLVDEAAGPEQRRRRGAGGGRRGHHRLRHQRGGVDRRRARRGEARVVDERPVERGGIGVDEQLRRIEPEAVLRLERPVGAEAVARARPERPATDAENVAVPLRRMRDRAARASPSKRQSPDRSAFADQTAKRCPSATGRGAERLSETDRGAQVMTSGAVRPVLLPIPAIVSAAATRSASASATGRCRACRSGGS